MEDPSATVGAAEDSKLAPGVRLGKYQIVRLLGMGGMGAVYEAVHTEIGKRVALKTLRPGVAAVPGARQRFLREAQLTARLKHPHIIDLTDMGTEGTTAYLVMELLVGEDLATRLARQGPFQVRDLVDLMLPVCSALVTAHAAEIIHRDLKPQNIFLERDVRGVAPKVLDFGISRSLDAASSLTTTGSVIGTPHYLSPEQIQDAHTASPASDQYSLGVVLYKCLANANPFSGESVFDILRAIATQPPVPLRDRRPDLPVAFAAVVARAMASLPWERFPSVRELGRALLPYASPRARVTWEDVFSETPVRTSATVPAAPIPRVTVELTEATLEADPPRTSRARRGVVLAVVVVLMLAAGAGVVALRAPQPRARVVAPPAPIAPPTVAPVPNPAPVATPPATTVPVEAPKRHPIERRHRAAAPEPPPSALPPRTLNPNGAPVIE